VGTATDLTRLYDTIPDPDTIRARLAELAREQRLLRTLLRIAMKKAGAVRSPAHKNRACETATVSDGRTHAVRRVC
jgi:hypothetical protein